LNRLDDKAGHKLCQDLEQNKSVIESLNLSSNLLGNSFCESLAEYLKLNESIRKLDISCNEVSESNAATLKDSLTSNYRITEIQVRNNHFTPETEAEINEIVLKNHLKMKNITFTKLGDYQGKVQGTEDDN
jgi:hypothetical protein